MDCNNILQKKKRIKIWGNRTNSLSEGPNLIPPIGVVMQNQHQKFRSEQFGRFDDAILLV